MDVILILLGIFVLLGLFILLLLVFFFWKRSSSLIRFEKTAHEGQSRVFLQAFIPLEKITIEDMVDGKPIVFVRENLKPGEKVEFLYPLSQEPVKLTAEGEENFTMERKLKT
jgi:hypothetical protein